MWDKARFEAKLADVRQQQKQMLANYNALQGVEQFCVQALAELEESPTMAPPAPRTED
jgi:hypothetical protein